MVVYVHALPCEYQRYHLHLTSVGLMCTFFDMLEQLSPPPPRRGFCPPFTAYPQMSRHFYHVRCCLLILPFHPVEKPSLSAFLSVMWSPLFLVHTSHILSVCCDHCTPVMTAVVSTCQCVKMIVICTNNHSHNTVWSKASSVNLPCKINTLRRPALRSNSYMYLLVETSTVGKSKAFALWKASICPLLTLLSFTTYPCHYNRYDKSVKSEKPPMTIHGWCLYISCGYIMN